MSNSSSVIKKEVGTAVDDFEISKLEFMNDFSLSANAATDVANDLDGADDGGDTSSLTSSDDDTFNPHDSSAPHQWNQEDTIKLNPSQASVRRRPVAVHKELLCYYSRYYYAALKGESVVADKDNFDVDTDYETLSLFIGWIYTGRFDTDIEPDDLVRLYILADGKEIMALRRSALQGLQAKTIARSLVGLSSVRLAYQCLPGSSPLLQFINQAYINHFRPILDPQEHGDADKDPRVEAYTQLIENIPSTFFYKVLMGQSASLHSGARALAKPLCDCCHNICKFHEHDSDDERWKTCGLSGPEMVKREEATRRRLLAEAERTKADFNRQQAAVAVARARGNLGFIG